MDKELMLKYKMNCPFCKEIIDYKAQPRFIGTISECYHCGEDVELKDE